jgi:transposase InsO family protein
MNKKQTPEDVAAKRLSMITPLLEADLDPARMVELKKNISEAHECSYRSISRYLQAYQREGFGGLKPKTGYKRTQDLQVEDFSEILEEAIILRRECPTRSINDIIRILEHEERIKPGSLHRSTLQRHMQAAGFGAAQIRIYTKKGMAARRFAKPNRCMLYQGDIKYGPYLPIGKNGALKQVYLSAFIDDATRYIVSARFYDNQKVDIIEDSLRSAIMHFGKPDKIFVDNGKQYRSEWLKRACERLGIRLLFSKPYHPEGKGKIESFNRRMDAFLSEVALDKPKTLDELNDAPDLWIREYYHKNPHSSLDGLCPEVAFRSDKRSLRFIDAKELAQAFLHSESRRVDKTGCISFEGEKYEVGLSFIGRSVDVHYDPSWRHEVEIHHTDHPPFKAKILTIGENCGIRAELPKSMTPIDSPSSRLLDGLNKANRTGKTKANAAISFRALGGGDDV